MLFNSYGFILGLLPVYLLGFFLLRRQAARLVWTIAVSYVFYGWGTHWLPALMAASTLIAYLGGRAIGASEGRRRQTAALVTGVCGVLVLLLYFKYAGFGAYYLSRVVTTVTGTGLPTLVQFTQGIVLPIGISFYTFESISYLVDVYRGDLEPEESLLRYAFFVSFFPHLIAGPIVRYGILGPQLRRFAAFDWDRLRGGLVLFAVGLSKKVLLADGIAFKINPLFEHPEQLGFVDGWMAMLGYAFQIYFDFSAYTDMALGLAAIVGIELPWNFDRPYRSASPREFWRRWHVTLSTWLRDYLYVPLGGSRGVGPVRRDANLMATMGLGGLWHGAQLNFLGWGLYHGTLLVSNHHLGRFFRSVPRVVKVVGTFALVTLGWVLFRFHLTSEIRSVYEAMLGANGVGTWISGLAPYLAISGVLMWGFPEDWRQEPRGWGFGRLALAGVAAAFAIVSLNDSQQFLYFRF